jgi:hypothetical protein
MSMSALQSQIRTALDAGTDVELKTDAYHGLMRVTDTSMLDLDTLDCINSEGRRVIIPYHAILGVYIGGND